MAPRNPFRRRRRRPNRRGASPDDLDHLREWAAARGEVEAYVEPRTLVTETTVVLVAADGEWTRRRIGSLATAQKFGREHRIPVYEVTKTGYPRRMRDFTARRRILERRRRAGQDDPTGSRGAPGHDSP